MEANDHENAVIGEGTRVEEGVRVGFRYHPACGPARIGRWGVLRCGTVIYGDVRAGDYLQTGHYTVIRAKARLGDYCAVANRTTIEGIFRCGSGARIMSHVYIPTRTWFGDHVFVGPGTTFLNSRYPCRLPDTPCPRGATVEDEVMIGGGVTVLPEVRIGRGSFIAAGAVVTRDVPPGSMVVGAPGKIKPLPEKLNVPNDRRITVQPRDLWHPDTEDLDALTWPEDWPEKWEGSE